MKTTYTYDGAGRFSYAAESKGATLNSPCQYGSTDQNTLNSMPRDGKTYFYLTDALGSVIAVADESSTKVNTYRYSPRGVMYQRRRQFR